MERVNFRCGHCGQLIAVSSQHLGQQVRCPHCQKVVLAPASIPAAPPPPPPPVPAAQTLDQTFAISPPPIVRDEEHDSIFTAPTQNDDLFGPASSPRVQFPTEVMQPHPDRTEQIPVPNLELTATAGPVARVPGPPDATLTYVPNESPLANIGTDGQQTLAHDFSAPEPSQEPAPWSPSTRGSNEALPDAETAAMLARPRSRSGWHIALIIIPLISYAILASIAVIILWMRQQEKPPHQLEILPDIEGEFPTNLKGTKTSVHKRIQENSLKIYPRYDTKLPENLKVALGKTLQLGELEITPVRIEQKSISLRELGKKQTYEPNGKALLLHLRLKNVSKDLAFHPLDRYYTRYFRPSPPRDAMRCPSNDVPYTYLEIGKDRFYGGPGGFYDLDLDKFNKHGYMNEYVVGQDFDTQLKPGEELKTFICTDPEDPKLRKALDTYKGKVTWRIQVRRGSIVYADRRIPVSAVIGVEFDDEDYKSKG